METPYEPRLGILMLDTQFPRIPGDIGNAQTWEFPVQYEIITGATPQAIVCSDADPFVQAFVAGGRRLVEAGCQAIATSCGFLTVMRPQLSAALAVPVATSALEQAGQIRSLLLPENHLSILTISKDSLSDAHLRAATVPQDTVIKGMEGTHFAQTILDNAPDLNTKIAEAEMVTAAQDLMNTAPKTGAILLECTNMVPYAARVQAATGVPVYSIYSYLNWFYESLSPRLFPSD